MLSYKALNRKSTPRWRGPAKILGFDEPGAAAKLQPQTFEAVRYCARKKAEEQDADEVECNPMPSEWKPMQAPPKGNINSGTNGNGMEGGEEQAGLAPSAGVPGDRPQSSPAAIPVPASPSLLLQAPSSHSLSGQPPETASSFDRKCAQSQAPVIHRAP